MQQYSTTMINSLIKENDSIIFSFEKYTTCIFMYDIISKACIGLIIAMCALIIVFEDAINAFIEYLLHMNASICEMLFNYDNNDPHCADPIIQKYTPQLRRSARIAAKAN